MAKIINNFKPSHYIGDKSTRYLLGKIGRKNALFIGVNPSKADNTTPDSTIRKIIGFATRNGYDGWFVVNIYPQRSTNPADLDRKPNKLWIKKNIKIIASLMRRVNIDVIVACWGRLITSRHFLRKALLDAIKFGKLDRVACVCIDKTADCIPKHPSRHKYGKFIAFSLGEIKFKRK